MRNWFFGLVALFLCVSDVFAEKISLNSHEFNVEIAQTAQAMRQGLMLRKELAHNAGMLFVHSNPRMVSMWMKDTLIDLDMLFVDAAGKIIGIHTAQAYDLSRINSPAPVKYVLEINAGLAKKLGLKTGDILKLNN